MHQSYRFPFANSLRTLRVCALVGAGAAACSSKPTVVVDRPDSGSGGRGNQLDSGQSGFGATGYQSDGAAGDDSGPHNCGQSKLEATARPVNVVVLLDRSLSMSSALSSTDSTTRWQAMRQALNAAMAAVQDRVGFGLKLFPDSTADCALTQAGLAVNVGLGASVVSRIDQTIGAATPAGGTPTAAALNQVSDYYLTGEGSALTGDRVVLLATDGAPNCNAQLTCDLGACIANIENPSQPQNICQYDPSQCLDQADATKAVSDLYANKIRTVVVGIPGTEYSQYQTVLNQMGAVGGLPNPDPSYDYFPVTAASGAAGLTTTLEHITTSLIMSCKLQLSSQPPDEGLLNVVIDGTTIAQSGDDGWSLDTTTSPPTVVLKGATCEHMQTNGAQSVEITYGCPTILVR
jgi:hypothetical protein